MNVRNFTLSALLAAPALLLAGCATDGYGYGGRYGYSGDGSWSGYGYPAYGYGTSPYRSYGYAYPRYSYGYGYPYRYSRYSRYGSPYYGSPFYGSSRFSLIVSGGHHRSHSRGYRHRRGH